MSDFSFGFSKLRHPPLIRSDELFGDLWWKKRWTKRVQARPKHSFWSLQRWPDTTESSWAVERETHPLRANDPGVRLETGHDDWGSVLSKGCWCLVLVNVAHRSFADLAQKKVCKKIATPTYLQNGCARSSCCQRVCLTQRSNNLHGLKVFFHVPPKATIALRILWTLGFLFTSCSSHPWSDRSLRLALWGGTFDRSLVARLGCQLAFSIIN